MVSKLGYRCHYNTTTAHALLNYGLNLTNPEIFEQDLSTLGSEKGAFDTFDPFEPTHWCDPCLSSPPLIDPCFSSEGGRRTIGDKDPANNLVTTSGHHCTILEAGHLLNAPNGPEHHQDLGCIQAAKLGWAQSPTTGTKSGGSQPKTGAGGPEKYPRPNLDVIPCPNEPQGCAQGLKRLDEPKWHVDASHPQSGFLDKATPLTTRVSFEPLGHQKGDQGPGYHPESGFFEGVFTTGAR